MSITNGGKEKQSKNVLKNIINNNSHTEWNKYFKTNKYFHHYQCTSFYL